MNSINITSKDMTMARMSYRQSEEDADMLRLMQAAKEHENRKPISSATQIPAGGYNYGNCGNCGA